VFVNPAELASGSEIVQGILAHQGEEIRPASIPPMEDALLEHWIRVGFDPLNVVDQNLASSVFQ
jgi:hypothetical protein